MALNYDATPAEINQEHERTLTTAPVTRTVVGLFEDVLDMRSALEDLRKNGCDPDQVSIVLYDETSSTGPASSRHGGVARAIEMSNLTSVAQWLTHLTTIIVPERGVFLVAGPVGLTLAGLNTERANLHLPDQSALAQTLCGFGFGVDEASYIDQRLAAGASLVSVTSHDQSLASSTQEWFGDVGAVYLGSATTSKHLVASVEHLTVAPPEVFSEGDVVVTDAVAQLSGLRDSEHPLTSLRGQTVVDSDGQNVGSIEDIVAEVIQSGEASGEQRVPRYVIVTHGGMLGIGRKRAAVPVSLVDLDASPVQIHVDNETIERAPGWDTDAPFSRREEHLVCAYFGVQPYWMTANE
jgi:sporulation protein YlmC with PRC-barrel domain